MNHEVSADPALRALTRLIPIGKSDTGQASVVASFLLAWWTAPAWGGFDLANLWRLDHRIRDDIVTVFCDVAVNPATYADVYGFEIDMHEIIDRWGRAFKSRRRKR